MKALLQYTAFTLHDENDVAYGPLVQGAGGLNADGALAVAHAIDTSLAGSNWFVAPFTPFSRHSNGVLPWAQNVVWGETWSGARTCSGARTSSGRERRLG